jgi:hypothetical protein
VLETERQRMKTAYLETKALVGGVAKNNLVVSIVLIVFGILFLAGAGAEGSVTCAKTPALAQLLNLPNCNSLVAIVFFLAALGIICFILGGVILLVGRTRKPETHVTTSIQQPTSVNVPTQAQVASRFCSMCGNPVATQSQFCSKCGAKL